MRACHGDVHRVGVQRREHRRVVRAVDDVEQVGPAAPDRPAGHAGGADRVGELGGDGRVRPLVLLDPVGADPGMQGDPHDGAILMRRPMAGSLISSLGDSKGIPQRGGDVKRAQP